MASLPVQDDMTNRTEIRRRKPLIASRQLAANVEDESSEVDQTKEAIVLIRGESLENHIEHDAEPLEEVIVIKPNSKEHTSQQLTLNTPTSTNASYIHSDQTDNEANHSSSPTVILPTKSDHVDSAEVKSTEENTPLILEDTTIETSHDRGCPDPVKNNLNDDATAPWMHYMKSVEDVTFDDLWEKSGMAESDEYNCDNGERKEADTDESANESKDGNGHLPLYDAIGQLDDSSSILNSKYAPPRLDDSIQQNVERKYIEELKLSLAEEDIKEYLDEFEKEVQTEILMIGTIALEDVQDEEKKLRDDHISFQEQLAQQQRQRKEEIIVAMEKAKFNVMKRFQEKQRQIQMREDHVMQKDRLIQDKIHRAFRRSEEQLLRALNKRKGEVKTMYGDLTFADGQYGGSRGRRWKVDWNKTPQPIQIKLKCLRGVKDKLPRSRYVVMVSLYDRLGGHVMKWSNLRGQQWGGATLPIGHDGEFYNIEMEIDQSVFTVCPSQSAMRPGMVIVFELFILRGDITPTDKVIGWGCFPVCDGEFNVIDGKYKCPLLRGHMDPSIDKFETIEKLIANDLDHWLSNLYFEIVKLPRYMSGQREFEVELQFSANLVNFPNRLDDNDDEPADGQKPILGSHVDVGSSRFSLESARPITSTDEKMPGPSSALVDTTLISNKSLQVPSTDKSSSDLRKRRGSEASTHSNNSTRPCTVLSSRDIIDKRNDESNSDYSDDDVNCVANDVGFRPVRGQPGVFSKLYLSNPADEYARKSCTIVPKTPLLGSRRRRHVLTHVEQLEQYTYHIKSSSSNKGQLPRRARDKAQYVRRMLLSELGLAQIKSRDFWAMILVLLLTWWLRLYLHYFGQWIFLQAIFIPINRFDLLPYTVNLNYQNTLLRSREEIAMIVIGPFTNLIVLIVMLLLAWFVRSLFGRFSNILSRFIMAFGINTLLDPIWIAAVDSALMRFEFAGGDVPIGDAFKLYWHFDRYYNNDNVSLFVSAGITVFVYAVTMFACATVLYMYFMKLHNNARLMDVYWRLHGEDSDIFIPFDLELTNEELNYICRKAEQWRGKEGERRKTTVYDYVWHENKDNIASVSSKSKGRESTTHVSIFSIHLDGLRELYRQFLRLPNGTLVEMFGDFSLPGIDDRIRESVREKTQQGYRFSNNLGNQSRRQSQASSAAISVYHLDVPHGSNI